DGEVFAAQGDRVVHEPRVDLRRERRVGPGAEAPEPVGVTGNVGFGEDDQPRALGAGVADVLGGAGQRLLAGEEHGRRLDDRDSAHARNVLRSYRMAIEPFTFSAVSLRPPRPTVVLTRSWYSFPSTEIEPRTVRAEISASKREGICAEMSPLTVASLISP